MPIDPLIAVEQVSLIRSGHEVLSDVSLTVMPGRIVTIVGPNGAGKSSLIKVALGLLPPDRGQVRRAPGVTIGYVPQSLKVEPTLPLSVRRFLAMAAPKVSSADLTAALDQVGAPQVLTRQVAHLSGGESQRVLLARALLRRPSLLVLDEPVGGVDMAGQAEIYDLIGRIAREDGTGVLMVSHDLHVVMAATDEVVCLNHHVCCAGHPEAVSRHPDYLALFGAQVAASLAVYTHVHDHQHQPDGSVQAHVHGPDCHHG